MKMTPSRCCAAWTLKTRSAREWFGVVKNDDGRGDESNYPFTLHIDYQKDAFYLDYGYDDADARQLQKPIFRPVRWPRKAFHRVR
ncbi:hypothetical protein M5585_15520 [Serratia ureilytica]